MLTSAFDPKRTIHVGLNFQGGVALRVLFGRFHKRTFCMLEGFARAVVGALIFGLIGPPVGYYTALIILHAFDSRAGSIDVLHPVNGLGLVFAYWIFGIPAMAVGVVAGLLRPWVRGWLDYCAIGTIGGVLLFGRAAAGVGGANWNQVAVLTSALTGGTVSAWVLCIVQKRPENDLW